MPEAADLGWGAEFRVTLPQSTAVSRDRRLIERRDNRRLGPAMESPLHIAPFSIHIEAQVLSDLRVRIRNTRWPDPAPGTAWEQGTDLEYLRQLLAYWADGFDWQARERELNAATQFRAELDCAHTPFFQ